jgi:hypothetical protein
MAPGQWQLDGRAVSALKPVQCHRYAEEIRQILERRRLYRLDAKALPVRRG